MASYESEKGLTLTLVSVYSVTLVFVPATHVSACESSSDWLRSRRALKIHLRLAVLSVLERLEIVIANGPDDRSDPAAGSGGSASGSGGSTASAGRSTQA
jgi:hypothetical protein